MKKRIMFFVLLAILLAVFVLLNYSSVQAPENIEIINITNAGGIITVEGEITSSFRDVYSVGSETEGNICYITVTGKNALMPSKTGFEHSFSNKNNIIKEIYLKDKNDYKLIYTNPDYGKPVYNFGESSFSAK